ncbi:uncharacterized protein LOC108195857 [Daucus carota subsp. sativus]|uniref:uncharacterized protein LOC108195857 n=1 Tax=Daucus carota subsp. sativus TaxID=79200 RepID=UPI0007EFD9C8|nr:PREDICTED: uncharacterized protein LOC108195857 [Daucus carota subsp. sativus]
MGTTRSSLTRMLRAAVSHRITTPTLPHPDNNLHHILTSTSTLFSAPPDHFNPRISNPHFFSTSRRVESRATKPDLLRLLSKPWVSRGTKSKLRRLYKKLVNGMRRVIIHICVTGVSIIMLGQFLAKYCESLDHEMGTKFSGSLPDYLRKGHTVVIDGFIKPVSTCGELSKGFEYYYAVTEVLSEPHEIVAAMAGNKHIINVKQNVATEGEELNIGCITAEDKVSDDVANPSTTPGELVLEGRVKQSVVFSWMAKVEIERKLWEVLYDFEGLGDALREGHSVFVKRSVKPVKHQEMEEEDKSGKIVAVKVWDRECNISAEVLAKHDGKCMPQDAPAVAIED